MTCITLETIERSELERIHAKREGNQRHLGWFFFLFFSFSFFLFLGWFCIFFLDVVLFVLYCSGLFLFVFRSFFFYDVFYLFFMFLLFLFVSPSFLFIYNGFQAVLQDFKGLFGVLWGALALDLQDF